MTSRGTTPISRRTALAMLGAVVSVPARADIPFIAFSDRLAPASAESTPAPQEPVSPKIPAMKGMPATGMTKTDLQQIDQTAAPTVLGLPDTRGLWLYNPNTNEELVTLFWVKGQDDKPGYNQICRILRDWREDQRVAMDPRLFHLMWTIQRGDRFNRPLIVNSGYRTPHTNALLASEGAAPASYHMQGNACDLVLDGISPQKVAEYVHSMKRGGVGFYQRFTHVDTGPLRTWQG